jgi:hypothetical protein|tara:strand:+ start:434 stop:1027 length:594 start_codon:yes stop_codon:yes gene_type:complete
MKLINLLSEQIESNSSQVEKRLRTLFSAMQDVKGIDNVASCISSNKSREKCMGHHVHLVTQTEVLSLLRLFGYNALDKMRFDQFDMFYWLVTCFIANGGYARTFSQGPLEAVNLEIIVREMQAEYDEEIIQTREGWSDLYDMSDDEDAKEYYLDNFTNLYQDSEMVDDDYGDVIDVRNPEVVAHRIIKLNPEWIGLN